MMKLGNRDEVMKMARVVAMLMDGRVEAARMAWNSAGTWPMLRELRMSATGDTVHLVPEHGDAMHYAMDDVIASLDEALHETRLER